MADEAPGWEQRWDEREAIEDDRLRLVFTCCHPSLSEEARIALTLREVCGLTTEAIAGAFLIATPTLAQRIVRAKAKIAAARIPYEVPDAASGRRDWPACCAWSTWSSTRAIRRTAPRWPTKPCAWPGCCNRCCPSPR